MIVSSNQSHKPSFSRRWARNYRRTRKTHSSHTSTYLHMGKHTSAHTSHTYEDARMRVHSHARTQTCSLINRNKCEYIRAHTHTYAQTYIITEGLCCHNAQTHFMNVNIYERIKASKKKRSSLEEATIL